MKSRIARPIEMLVIAALSAGAASCASNTPQDVSDPALTEVWEPVPKAVTPAAPGTAPSDAIVLFAGDDVSAWQHLDGRDAEWLVEDGVLTVAPGTGDIVTRQGFGDVQLHIEWRTPAAIEGDGQGRGNSGVFLQQRYEMQVLDSFRNVTYSNGQAASIYKQHIPLVNAMTAPGTWQVYDIVFRAPRFDDDGALLEPAYVTAFHNGVLVLDHVEIEGATEYIGPPSYQAHAPREPLLLQDHSNPVSFRNIWIREL